MTACPQCHSDVADLADRAGHKMDCTEPGRHAGLPDPRCTDHSMTGPDHDACRHPEPLWPEVTVHLSTGHDGSIGAIMGTVRDAMRRAGVPDYGTVVSRMWAEVFKTESYTESLTIVMRYVDVT